MNFLKELRDAGLWMTAFDLATKLRRLSSDPTHENMRNLNGAWARAVRKLEEIRPTGDDGVAA